MTSAQVVETSVTNNSSFQNYTHPDDHTIRTTDTPGFKPFTIRILLQDRFLMTEDNLYFGRSKYVVLPELRNDWVDENLLPFSKSKTFVDL